MQEQIQQRTKKVLQGYVCSKLVEEYNVFKEQLISDYQSRVKEKVNDVSENCEELKQLRQRNKLLQVEAFRYKYMKQRANTIDKKRRLKSAH